MIGVYRLTSASGNFYIGSSRNVKGRLADHRKRMARGQHDNVKLQRAYDKHGPLREEILLACRQEDLIFYEQLCMDGLKPAYNQSQTAGRTEMTPEIRAKLSAAHKGRKHGPHTDEHRAKISAANLGRTRGPLTAEIRAKLSAANKGKTIDAETRAKISATLKGRVKTVEHLAKLGAARKGRPTKPHTVEARAKIGEASKRMWAERRDLQLLSEYANNVARQTGDA